MTTFLGRTARGSMLALGLTAAASAQGPAEQRDLLDGTWRLNVARSDMTGPSASSSETVVFKVRGDVESFESHAVQAADGAREHTGYKATYGGPPAAMASIYVLPSGVVSRVELGRSQVVRTDAHTRERLVVDGNGRTLMRALRKISADGNTLTSTLLGADGKPMQTRVFERVE